MIADFGLALNVESMEPALYSFSGTDHYIAPEIVRKEKYNYKVDLYAAGILIHELCCLQAAYSGTCDQ